MHLNDISVQVCQQIQVTCDLMLPIAALSLLILCMSARILYTLQLALYMGLKHIFHCTLHYFILMIPYHVKLHYILLHYIVECYDYRSLYYITLHCVMIIPYIIYYTELRLKYITSGDYK